MAYADAVSFVAGTGGTGAFIFGSARASFRTPAQAVADGALMDGGTYSYLAQDSLTNPIQREWGHAVFTQATLSFARTPLGGINAGTDTGLAPVNFNGPPVVSLTLLREDLAIPLTQDTNFYVTKTGSNSNNGLSPADAWATLQFAWDTISSQYNLNNFRAKINAGPGIWQGITSVAFPGGSGIIDIFGAGNTTAFIDCSMDMALQGISLADTPVTVNIAGFSYLLAPGGATAISLTNVRAFNVNSDGPAFPNDSLIFDLTNADGSSVCLSANNSIANINKQTTFKNGGTSSAFGFIANNFALINNANGNVVFSGVPNFNQYVQATVFAQYFENASSYTGTVNASSIWYDINAFGSFLTDVSPSSASSTGFVSGGLSDGTSAAGFSSNFNALSAFGVQPLQGNPYSSFLKTNDTFELFKQDQGSVNPRTVAVRDGGVIYVRQVGNFINTQTGTPYTLVLDDQEGIVEMNLAGGNTLTVPANATVAFPIGTKISVVQAGAGATTIAAAGGVTVHNAGALPGQWKSALLYKRATDEWVQINGAF